MSRAAAQPMLEDVSAEAGLSFVHQNGMTGDLYFPEMTGQGGALFDFDADGDLDVYLIQGGPLDADLEGGARRPTDRLLRNDLTVNAAGQPVVRLIDVTAKSKLRSDGYGMGVATGDIDGDGDVDIYVTNFGPNQLWRNRGDGTFEEIAEDSGVAGNEWSTSASWFDADGDGDLDLYVANYVKWDLHQNPECYAPSSRRDYCGPSGFAPERDRFYRNLGGGRFDDITTQSLRGYRPGPSLGVIHGDFDGDGDEDLFVANDGAHNQLWMNQGDRTFREQALLQGAAVNRDGEPEASMGIAPADFDNDGDEDFFVTHLAGETNTLYVNNGEAFFEDRTREWNLATASLPNTSFGTAWLDLENDGQLDLFVASGEVKIIEELRKAGDRYPLGQKNQLYARRGNRFVDISNQEPSLGAEHVSRGVASGDVDNDGDTDLLIFNSAGPARLLANTQGQSGAWIGFVDTNFAARGSVTAQTGDVSLRGGWRTDGSYCVASDPRIRFGLGTVANIQNLTRSDGVRWRGLQSRRYYVMETPN